MDRGSLLFTVLADLVSVLTGNDLLIEVLYADDLVLISETVMGLQ